MRELLLQPHKSEPLIWTTVFTGRERFKVKQFSNATIKVKLVQFKSPHPNRYTLQYNTLSLPSLCGRAFTIPSAVNHHYLVQPLLITFLCWQIKAVCLRPASLSLSDHMLFVYLRLCIAKPKNSSEQFATPGVNRKGRFF